MPHTRLLVVENLEQRQLLTASAIGGSVLVNLPTIGDQRLDAGADAVAFLNDGSSIVAYHGRGVGDRDGVFLRRFDAQGAGIGTAQLVNQTIDGLQSNSTVAALPGGGFVAAWQGRGTGDRAGVFARWYDGAANALTGEMRINQTVGGGQFEPQVAIAADGTALFVWHGVGAGDFDGVFARSFSAAGAALSNEVLVNATTAREQAFADVAIGDDDTALVTWSSRHQDGSDWGVFAQRLSLSGSKQGSEFRVNTNTAGSQMSASVAALDAGFAVAWQSRGQDGDGWGVYAQQVGPTSSLVGSEFRLNTESAGNQTEVALGVTGDDMILAAWTDGKPDGTGWNVRAREIELSAAAPVPGDEFVVHPSTATAAFGHQSAPSIAARADTAAITWTGDGPPDHDGVYLQRFGLAVNLPPNLATITGPTIQVGTQMQVTVTATDPNPGDTLTYLLDADNSPDDATIERINNNQAIIRWRPENADLPGPILFRVLVVDNGVPALADSQDFSVTLTPVS
jgi:hypothetical protein